MKIPTEVRLCWDFFLGGALVSSAPTEQNCTNRVEMHHLLCWCSRDCCTPLEGTNRARTAPTALTIRGYVGVRGYGIPAIPSYNCSP